MPALNLYEFGNEDEEIIQELEINHNNRPRRNAMRRRPARFIEKYFPSFINDKPSKLPRSTANVRRTPFLSVDPDYIMEVQIDPVDNKPKYACGWYMSSKFKWFSHEEVKEKYRDLFFDYCRRTNDYVPREEPDDDDE